MDTNSFNCKHCGTEVSIDHRTHNCVGAGTLHGQKVNVATIYTPNFPKKASKQVLQAGYMKRFGTHPRINVVDRQALADIAEWQMSGETATVI